MTKEQAGEDQGGAGERTKEEQARIKEQAGEDKGGAGERTKEEQARIKEDQAMRGLRALVALGRRGEV